MKNTIIGELPDLKSIPKCTKNIIAVPGYAHFFDESEGPIGNWLWEFGDNSHSTIRHPSHYFQNPGVYNINLTVVGLNGFSDSKSFTLVAISNNSETYSEGDLNNDGIINTQDLTLCLSYILGFITFSPEQFIAADFDNNFRIEIYDLFLISDNIN